MIDDDVLNRVYNILTFYPQRTLDMAKALHMDRRKLSFILTILKRQGKAKRINLSIISAGYSSTRSYWKKENTQKE